MMAFASLTVKRIINVAALHNFILYRLWVHMQETLISFMKVYALKSGTHTRVLSPTLAQGSSNNQAKQCDRRAPQAEKRKYEKVYGDHEIRKSRKPNLQHN